MRVLNENHQGFSTILALALIPLSGFATDIYLPSLPSMAKEIAATPAAIQLTLVFFMFSLGISQIFIGSILDSFGRFKISIFSLLIFSITNFLIVLFPDIYLIYVMRVIQGIAIAFIVVGKRAYFVDLYTGDKLKSYVSLFAIIWSCAPIMAPFLGGYLQEITGTWKANFYFLGGLSLLFLILELFFSGESIKNRHPFKLKPIVLTYSNMLKASDFSLGLLMLGTCFGLVIVYNLSSPFIIERIFGYSSVTTGYSSLFSGISVMSGGIIAKLLIGKPLTKKVTFGLLIQTLIVLLMIVSSKIGSNIYTLVAFTVGINLCGGFIFNIIYGYCLSRFSNNAGVASGLTGGAMYMVSSIFSYSFANLFEIKSQFLLGLANFCLIFLIGLFFACFNYIRKTKPNKVLNTI